jgi:hypothetical protein
VNDAADVAAALRSIGYTVTTLFDSQATKAGMRRALEAFSAELGQGGVGFFFFAGENPSAAPPPAPPAPPRPSSTPCRCCAASLNPKP